MTTSKEHEVKKPLSLNRPGRLELKKTVETGQVRQSFSHGRSKAVTVEVKRKRTFAPGAGGRMREVTKAREAAEQAFTEPSAPVGDVVAEPERTELPDNLTAHERAVRMRALEVAKKEEEQRREIEEKERIAKEEQRKREEAEAKLRAEEEARLKAEEEARQEAEDQARQKQDQSEADTPTPEPAPVEQPTEERAPARAKARAPDPTEETEESRGKRKVAPPKVPGGRRSSDRRRQTGKLTISQALDDSGGRVRSLASVRRQREKLRAMQAPQQRQAKSKVIREVVIPESITVQELANRMAERGGEVVKSLMKMGVMSTINQVIDADTAELVVAEFGHKVKRVSASDVEIGLKGDEDKDEALLPRPPIVTVMGHVDHGKTSLLDALRETDVAGREAGGITQHIGAYQVRVASGERITFIDTPGHAAFTEMRARGATVTDIVVLIVAADDGIMAQTEEAIAHAKAAEVPIIVAINKMDRPDANAERVQQDLLKYDLVVEEMGGEILCIPISAKERTNLDKLVEAILLQAEVMELKANPERNAEGVIIEAKLEQGRGAVGTVLVQRGTLQVGDVFVAGDEWGKVRALINDRGEKVDEAGPSVPVEVLGLGGVPLAGDEFVSVENEAKARDVTNFRRSARREADIIASGRGTLEQLMSRIKDGEVKELPVIVKSDVHGSLEAINASLKTLGNNEVAVRVLHAGVGGITESDITLARSTGAMVIGFNVRANPQARDMARRDGIEISYYSIIYNVIDDMKAALSGMLAPTRKESFLGYAQIREVFNVSKAGKVAGCMVTEGIVRRGARVRLLRDNVVIHDGTLKTLRRFKDEVREVRDGYECGMAFENYQDLQVNDQIECYEIEEVARAL